MSSIIYFIYQFIPIAIGIAFLFAVKSLNLINSKVQILIPQPEQLTESYQYANYLPKFYPANDSIVKEQLIINGKLPKNKNVNICDYAIHHAGIANYNNLKDIGESLKKHKQGRLTIILSDRKLLLRSLSRFDQTAGIVLAYSIEQKLHVVG
jgi:hypothetical protein